jgi:hypothetical protein
VLSKSGIVCGVVLRDHPDAGTVAHCEAEPREPGEAWSDFVARAAGECISALDAMHVEKRVIPEQADWLLYNLTWVDEQAYGRPYDR